jgi:hypothetical protein
MRKRMSTPNTTTIEVEQSTAALLQTLKEQADAQGLSLDSLLRPLTEAEFSEQAEETSSPYPKEHNPVEHDAEVATGNPQPNSLAALHPNQLWLQANRDDYRGQWVVLYQGTLIAHGTDGVAAVETARSQSIPEPFVAFIPAEDNPFAGF